MKKKSWNRASKYRCHTRNLAKLKKFLKKNRHKKARKSNNPELVYKTTGAWDII